MTLENVLANLTDYVDLGTKLLESKSITCFEDALNAFAEDEHLTKIITDKFFIDDLLDEYDSSDIANYYSNHYSFSDFLSESNYDDNDVCEYVAYEELGNSVLDKMSKSQLRDYLKNNYDWDDFVDVDWRY